MDIASVIQYQDMRSIADPNVSYPLTLGVISELKSDNKID